MLRVITNDDLDAIRQMNHGEYDIIDARRKDGPFSDSDCYGIALATTHDGDFVTWQFHYDDDELHFYWGHYMEDDADAALRDYLGRQ